MRVIGRMVLAAVVLGLAGPAAADMAMQKKGKELQIAAVVNCQSCHTDKMPRKGAASVNAMGKWLVDQKAARKAREIDVSWLKDYKPAAK
jgi:mono/diheme cytochrome c family protein